MSTPAKALTHCLVLGCGFTGRSVARLARAAGLEVLTTVRTAARAAGLRNEGFEVLEAPSLDASIAERAHPSTLVVVAFPPDGETDARIHAAFSHVAAIVYVSTVGVYGDRRGAVDDTTPLPNPPTERGKRVLDAEAAWRSVGATVLRSPGIYGPERGLHLRVTRGEHKIPGDGSRYLSRIHVDDLAALVLAASQKRGETYVVGDLSPAPHGEVVAWIAEQYGVPLPPHVPLESVHETLRADRRVDASRALRELGVTLRYPTWREGMAPDGPAP